MSIMTPCFELSGFAEVHGCRGSTVDADDPRSYYQVAERIRDEEGAFLPYQYYNQENPKAHYRTTGPEIWRQTEGRVTHWAAGMGTGGTISGVGRYLKEQNPDIRVIGIDPAGSVYRYYHEHGELPPADQSHSYLIDGIGEDFLPTSMWWDVVDEVITIDDKSAYEAVLEVTRREGIFCGSSGGAAAAGALKVAESLDPEPDPLVVTLFPDSGERSLSKLNHEWMSEHDLV